MAEKLKEYPPRMPFNAYEQIQILPDFDFRMRISRNLFAGVGYYLNLLGVSFDKDLSTFRAKDVERIQEKITRRKSAVPVRDIYGIRIITEDPRREWIKDILQKAYPLTPDMFPDGKPSVREYANPTIREFFREKHNPHTSPLYSALHVNVVFERLGSHLFDIAEIQIMNKRELEIYNDTREEYLRNRTSGS